MSDSLESKLNRLEEQLDGGRDDAVAEVQAMRGLFKDAKLRKALGAQPAFVKLLSFLRRREAAYTLVLANKEDLDATKRAALFERRKECRFVLSFFDSADKSIETLEKQVDFQLEPGGE